LLRLQNQKEMIDNSKNNCQLSIVNYQSIKFGSKVIQFSLEYSERKTLGIYVNPEMQVIVRAPIDAPLEKIKEKIRKRAPWILKQLSFFLSYQPKSPDKKYISGETHLYMGRQFKLTIDNGKLAMENSVKLSGGEILINCNDKSKVRNIVEDWYRNKAKEKLEEIARPIINTFIQKHKLSIVNYQLSIQYMHTRWGSCTPKGKIILNPELIKAPRPCIEYVIIHELCHLVHHNHTQKFLDLQTKEMPDWEKWKEKLEMLLA
jgi:predicted metal-dependent hydrolase